MGYKFITSLYDLKFNSSCYISNHKFNEADCKSKNIIELDCKHAFHYKLFMKSYIELNKSMYTYLKCPYCMADISKIPFRITINK